MPDYRRVTETLFRDRQHRDLGDWVADRRNAIPPVPWRRIASELDGLTDGLIDVTAQTLLNWYGDREPAA